MRAQTLKKSKEVFARKYRIKQSTTAFQNEVKALDSSSFAQTLGPEVQIKGGMTSIKDYQINPLYHVQPIKTQLAEITGRALRDNTHTFHHEGYKQLLSKVVPLRSRFRTTDDINTRKKIASQECQEWRDYLENRKKEIDNRSISAKEKADLPYNESHPLFSHVPEPSELRLLREWYDRLKVSLVS